MVNGLVGCRKGFTTLACKADIFGNIFFFLRAFVAFFSYFHRKPLKYNDS